MSLIRAFALVSLACGTACGRSAPPAGAPPAQPTTAGNATGVGAVTASPDASPPPRTRYTLAEVGLDPAALDRSVDPCKEFYKFACGGWLAAAEVPPGRARWGRFDQIRRDVDQRLRVLLERAAVEPGDDPALRRLGRYYAACMDQAAVDAAGVAPITDLLVRVDRVTDPASLWSVLAELHRYRVPAVFVGDPGPDFADPGTVILHLDSAGLGLPDRDYYLEGKALGDITEQYVGHVRRMFELLGMPERQAVRAAADVLRVETELARLSKSRLERRVVADLYHRVDRKGLAALAPDLPWDDYFAGLGFPALAGISVTTPRYFAGLDRLASRLPASAWRSYLKWQVVHSVAAALPERFAAEDQVLVGLLGGADPPSRWRRCLVAAGAALGDDLGRAFASAEFAGDRKREATRLVDGLVAALRSDLGGLDWMQPETRQRALAKLDLLVRQIGYPGKWQPDDFVVDGGYAANLLAARAAAVRRQLSRVDRPRDRAEWAWPAYTVNASYDWLVNRLTLPAGVLRPPFFSTASHLPVNLGGLSLIAGHELIHGFDDEGGGYDGRGVQRSWWLPADRTEFAHRADCLSDQYSAERVLPDQSLDGRRVVAEAVADLGGVALAYRAYRALRGDDAGQGTADGFTEDQQFFLAVGQSACTAETESELRRQLSTGVQAPARLRVDVTLRNLPEFAAAFQCAEGAPMRPADRCTLW